MRWLVSSNPVWSMVPLEFCYHRFLYPDSLWTECFTLYGDVEGNIWSVLILVSTYCCTDTDALLDVGIIPCDTMMIPDC